MMGVLLAAMGGAGGGTGAPASFPLGGRTSQVRETTRVERAEGGRSNGVPNGPNKPENVQEKKAQADPDPAREGSLKRAREAARRPGDPDPTGRIGRSHAVSLTDQTERTMPRARRDEEEVNSSQPQGIPRNGKRGERSEGRSSMPADSVTRADGRGETSRQVRELRREMKKLREEALKGPTEAVTKWENPFSEEIMEEEPPP